MLDLLSTDNTTVPPNTSPRNGAAATSPRQEQEDYGFPNPTAATRYHESSEDAFGGERNNNGGIPIPQHSSMLLLADTDAAAAMMQPVSLANSLVTRHSAMTVQTSNFARSSSPPLRVINATATSAMTPTQMLSSSNKQQHPQQQQTQQQQQQQQQQDNNTNHHGDGNDDDDDDDDDNTTLTPPRRNIFGAAVEQRYQTTTDFSMLHPNLHPAPAFLPDFSFKHQIVIPPSPPMQQQPKRTVMSGLAVELSRQQQQETAAIQIMSPSNTTTNGVNGEEGEQSNLDDERDPERAEQLTREETGVAMFVMEGQPPMQRPLLGGRISSDVSELTIDLTQSSRNVLGFRIPTRTNNKQKKSAPTKKDKGTPHHLHQHKHNKRPLHETIHAQSFLLGLAFSAVWSPSNLMAPNLTEMADFYGFDNAQRDLYLGSYCALATSVFSFPMSAGIGILADMVNRKYLFCGTLLGGACAALATGMAVSYPQLLLARLCNGGFMAGSVPVAFSFLGDLFAVEERNAASSGLTAMMGLGIILGQVYAGTVGPTLGWQQPFQVSAAITLFFSLVCFALVQEPERGGKERVLQDLIRAGTRYERKLSWKGFVKACLQNPSNSILLWQGFFSSLPWGILFVFLNDYLSQERGLSVPAATYLLFLFGIGCAVGGVLGGYWGQQAQRINVAYLPLFMAVTTELGILPFLGLLNVKIPQAHGALGILFSFGSGLVASLPSVNVRPCLINVNLPETRGATLTAANLLIQLGRGIGPSCVTLLGSVGGLSRQQALNLTLTGFWTISALQLAWLARTLPQDQLAMEEELAKYAAVAMQQVREKQKEEEAEAQLLDDTFTNQQKERVVEFDDSTLPPFSSPNKPAVPRMTSYQSVSMVAPQYRADTEDEVTIAERMTYFDGTAVNQSLSYARQGFTELKQEFVDAMACAPCGADIAESSSEDNDLLDEKDDDDDDDDEDDNVNVVVKDPSSVAWRQKYSPSSSDQQEQAGGSNLLYSGPPPPIQSFSSASDSDYAPNEHTRLID